MVLLRILFLVLFLVPRVACAEAVEHAAYAPDPAVVSNARAWLAWHGQKPSDYVLQQFEHADVVLLGEDHRVRENLEFVRSILPRLYAAGVRVIGMEFGAAEDQAALDALVTGMNYDEDAARRIMFGYDTSWPYREYMEIYRAAWELNRTLPDDAPRVRVLNLSYRYDWSAAGPVMTPARAARIYRRGPVDRFRAARAASEVLDRREKMLALVGTIHAVSTFRWPVYDYTASDFVRSETAHFGNILASSYPGRVRTILLHQPFLDRLDGGTKLVQPAGGLIEAITQGPVAFDLQSSPMGILPDRSWLAGAELSIPMSAIADGYIILAPLSRLHGCTIDRAFVTLANWAEAKARFPRELRPVPETIDDYWRLVESYTDIGRLYENAR